MDSQVELRPELEGLVAQSMATLSKMRKRSLGFRSGTVFVSLERIHLAPSM